MKEKNLYYLIGFPSSGKSYILKEIKENIKIENKELLIFDEDALVLKESGYKSFSELLKKEDDIEFFYDIVHKKIKKYAKNNKDKIIFVGTGGFSPLFNQTKYKNGYSIYMKIKKKKMLKINKNRMKKENILFEILIFNKTGKVISREKANENNYDKFYDISNNIYDRIADLKIYNEINDLSIKKSLIKLNKYINKNIKPWNKNVNK